MFFLIYTFFYCGNHFENFAFNLFLVWGGILQSEKNKPAKNWNCPVYGCGTSFCPYKVFFFFFNFRCFQIDFTTKLVLILTVNNLPLVGKDNDLNLCL